MDTCSYEEGLAGPLKSDQFNNSAFQLHPVESGILYSDLISRLKDRIDKLNQTIEENERCRNSDDEDQCARNLFRSCIYSKPEPSKCGSGDCGSGSESGSGSGSDSSFQDDLESGPTELSFEEHTTSNAGDDNTDRNTNTKQKPVDNHFSNHFNNIPGKGAIPLSPKAVAVINIDPDEEEEEDTDVDATPTRTHVPWQENPETINGEKPKDVVHGRSGTQGQYFVDHGRSGTQGQYFVLPAMVIVMVLASVLATVIP